MSQPSSLPSLDDEVLARFLRELEATFDRGEVLRRYAAEHPHLADELRSLAEMNLALQGGGAAEQPAAPQRLGEFRVLRRLGLGGMGEIYLAEHERLPRRVAIKVIRRGRVSPQTRDRFLREQQALARLHQTHIVAIHTAGEEGELQYFVMPYIEGAALHHVLRAAWELETGGSSGQTPPLSQLAERLKAESEASPPTAIVGNSTPPHFLPSPPLRGRGAGGEGGLKDGPLTLSRAYVRSAAEAIAQAAEALEHAHAAGILHRDVKPANLMVDCHGQCWVIDFGLSCQARGGSSSGADAPAGSGQVTVSGLLGTPQYMAPEQWRQGKLDARSDVWGLGVTLYELLTLRRAFEGESAAELRLRVESAEPPRPRKLVPNCPRDLEAICVKAMSKEPAGRYATAGELAADVRRWLNHEPTKALPARAPRRVLLWSRRNPGWASALLMMVVAVIGVAGWLVAVGQARANDAERETERIKEQERTNKENADREIARAKQEERTRTREILVQKIQHLGLTEREPDWSKKAWEHVRAAAGIRRDVELRRHAIGTLAGLDAERGREFPKSASSVAFDRTGRRLLMGGREDQAARMWDDKTRSVTTFNKAAIGSVAFDDKDTPLQLIGGAGASVLLWDLAADREVNAFHLSAKQGGAKLEGWKLIPLALSSNGGHVAAAGHDPKNPKVGRFAVWEARSGKLLFESDAGEVTALALDPDGSHVAAATPGMVRVWSVAKGGAEVASMKSGRERIHCLTFGSSPYFREGGGGQAGLLAAGFAGGGITTWDVRQLTVLNHYRGSWWDVYALAFSPDGMTLLSAGRHWARVWDTFTGRLLLKLGGTNFMTGVAFAPDGKNVAVSSLAVFGASGGVERWVLRNGRGIRTLRGLTSPLAQVRYSPDGRRVAALAHNFEIAVWDTESDHLLCVVDGPRGLVADNSALAFSSDGKHLAAVSGREVVLWQAHNGKRIQSWSLPFGLSEGLTFRNDSTLFLVRNEPATGPPDPLKPPCVVRARELRVGADAAPILWESKDFSHRVHHLVLSTDGRYVAVEGLRGPTGKERAVVVYDGGSGKELWSVISKRAPGEGSGLIVSPCGKYLRAQTEGAREVERQLFVDTVTGRVVPTPAKGQPGIPLATRIWAELNGGRIYDPLTFLGVDVLPGMEIPAFSLTTPFFTLGMTSGSIAVWDVAEIESQLASARLLP